MCPHAVAMHVRTHICTHAYAMHVHTHQNISTTCAADSLYAGSTGTAESGGNPAGKLQLGAGRGAACATAVLDDPLTAAA